MNTPAFPELFSAVVALSWRAGWLILVLAALRRLVRGRVPAQVWFVAWILVALRLLLPFSLPADWSPYNLTAAQPPKAEMISPLLAPALLPSVAPLPLVATGAPKAIVATPAPSQPAARPRTRTEMLATAWLAGLAILAAARIAASWSFRRRLRQARPVADPRVVALIAQESASARVTLLETDAVDAPALYGLLRPRLLLPPGLAAQLTADELRHVVRHELGHWRRRDLLAQALLQAAVAVHWFNPLAWLAARLARADCELACDEFVLRRESPTGAGAYGATLLKVLGVVRGRRRPVAVVAMLENKAQLAQRIRLIASFRASTLGRVCAGVALVAGLAAVSFTRESQAATPAAPATSAKAPAGLVDSGAQSGPHLAELERQVQQFKEANGLVSLDTRRDILNDTLKATAAEERRVHAVLTAAQARLAQVKEARESGADLTVLPFIANQPLVVSLKERLATQRATRTSLSQRYRSQHPEMVKATSLIEQTERELAKAVDTACAQVEAECQAAQRQQKQTQADFAAQEAQLAAFQRNATELARREAAVRTAQQRLADGAAGAPATTEPSGDFTVSVMGAVNQQGGIRFSTADKPILLDALARSGGFSPSADRNAVRVIRLNARGGRSTYTVKESALMVGQDEVGVLQRGDIVVVPEKAEPAPRNVNVLGQVNNPGVIPFPRDQGLDLIEAIARAGGATRFANLRQVVLKRINADGTTSVTTIDVNEIMRGVSAETHPLQPGDIITVPERML